MDPIYSRFDQLVSSVKYLNCKLLFNTADDPDCQSQKIDLCDVMNSTTNYYFCARLDGLENQLKLVTADAPGFLSNSPLTFNCGMLS